MGKQVSANRMKRNVMVYVAAQVVSLLVGFILNLVVPKFISELDYSLWQAFLLYLGYVGVLHFGLLDGLLLRYAQYDYEELDKERISSQFQVLLVMTGTLCLAGLATALCLRSPAARWIVAYVSLGIVTKNVFTYNSYVLQLTNRIGGYARLIIAQRVSYGMLALLAVLAGWGDFRWFCAIDLFGDLIGSLYCLRLNRGLYLTKVTDRSLYRDETWENIRCGISLLLANWASMFLVGSARMVIQWRWDILLFGKISFAFSMTNLVLSLISAVSIVLFPSLKRMPMENLPVFYQRMRRLVVPFLLGCIWLYFPGCWLLERWLPAYQESLKYLGLMMPLIVYSSVIGLLTNNYLKAYRMERQLRSINLISLAFGFAGFLVSAYVFGSEEGVVLWAVFVTAIRSIFSEGLVERRLGLDFRKHHVLEFAVAALFVVLAVCFNS